MTDLFAYCAERLPRWNTISPRYHIREAGASAAQELAFTLANGIAYCEAAVAAGLSPDDFGERSSFFFNATTTSSRRSPSSERRAAWARIMSERFGATNPRAIALRFHAQTGGSTLTAQQPEINIVRVAIQALSANAGAQSLHTNSYDEALALPSEHAARIALRQQILASEAGGTDTGRPARRRVHHRGAHGRARAPSLGAHRARRRARRRGGSDRAGLRAGEIEASAFRYQSEVEGGERIVVGVNRFTDDDAERVELLQVDPESERRQRERTARVRAERDSVRRRASPRRGDRSGGDRRELLPPMREALRAHCTVGEICDALRGLWGTYDAQHA